MATLNDMVDEVSLHLSSYGMRNDAVTHITANVTSSATTATLYSTDSVGRGLIEIDDELIWVDAVDRNTGTITIPPYGRGYKGSTAASHTSGTMVTLNPTYSRKAIKTAINDTIRAVFPQLYGVSKYTFTYSPAVTTYSLPSSVESIIAISFEAIGATKEWVPVRGWRQDATSNVSAFNSTNSVTITSFVDPGATVQVAYTMEPEPLESNSDEFADTTGLPESAKDVIVLGAAYRLLSTVDPNRLSFSNAEAESQSSQIQFGSGTNTAKYIYALYQQRLAEEASKLVGKFPVRVHYTN